MADIGRPTIMTPDVIKKLEEVFLLGGTDGEACLFADISTQTLYTYQNDHPEFLERKNQLKQTPFLKARTTIVNTLDDPKNAQWFAERKLKAEFAQRSELTGPEGKEITTQVSKLDDDQLDKLITSVTRAVSGASLGKAEENQGEPPEVREAP